MQTDPQISFQNMDPSPTVEARIRERIDELEKFYPRITGCTVVVSAPHRHGQKGQIYDIRVRLDVPGANLVVTRDPGLNHAHEDILVAVRDSFDEARRILEDHVRVQSGHRSKPHPPTEHGHIDRVFTAEGYGFIRTEDSEDIYFQFDSLTKQDMASLNVDDPVRFKRQDGEKGPFAIHVTPIAK
jgi:cold shock CspA family protein/ribosome-associated translation inhibitor RaiA